MLPTTTKGEMEILSRDKIDLLKRTICKGATDDELELFVSVCKRLGLDPFARQVHAVKRYSRADGRESITIQVGIDGYRSIADRTGNYAGSDEPVYIPADESAPQPTKATVTVWKMVHGERRAFTASARWSEYAAIHPKTGKTLGKWEQMPYFMLSKCAEALALRKAFPAELGGVHTSEELERADAQDIPITQYQPSREELQEGIEESKRLRAKEQSEAPKAGRITKAQMDRLAAEMDYFLLSKEDMIAIVSHTLKRTIHAANEITPPEYQILLERFDRAKSSDDNLHIAADPMRFESSDPDAAE